MTSEWQMFRIGDLGKVITGKTPSTSVPENFGGSYPFVTIPDLGINREITVTARTLSERGMKAVGGSLLPPKAVMMSCIATIGKVGITSRPSVTNQQINAVICNDSVIPEFLYYSFTQLGSQMEATGGGGSVFTNISKSRFSDIKISLPPKNVQHAIADYLSTLDDRIALLRETNSTLEAIAQALFKSWFVDFDPVHAKAQGIAPEGMDEATAALFPDGFEESELGLVPRGWVAGKFRDVLKETTARVGRQEAIVLSAVQTGELVRSDEHFNKRVHSADIAKYKCVPPMSLAYNPSRINIGSIGFNEFDSLGAVSPIYVAATPRCAGSAYLVWHHLRTERVREWIKALASGTVRQSLSFSDFGSVPLVVPDTQVLKTFLQLRTSLYESINTNHAQAHTLAALRDALLPRLISGQLRLPEEQGALS